MRNGLNKILNFGADLKGIFWALRHSRFPPQIESKRVLGEGQHEASTKHYIGERKLVTLHLAVCDGVKELTDVLRCHYVFLFG